MAISFNAAVSGMQAAITRQDVTAHNVANVTTPGYEQETPYQTDVSPQGTRISHIARTPNADPNVSNTDLAKETVAQKENSSSLQANLQVARTQDRMTGTLFDMFA